MSIFLIGRVSQKPPLKQKGALAFQNSSLLVPKLDRIHHAIILHKLKFDLNSAYIQLKYTKIIFFGHTWH